MSGPVAKRTRTAADGQKPPISIPGPIDNEEPVQGARNGVAEQPRIGKRSVKGRSVRVGNMTDKEKASLPVSLRLEPVEVQRVLVGHRVESATPMRDKDGVTIVSIMSSAEIGLTLKQEPHVRHVAETREHKQTVLRPHQGGAAAHGGQAAD